MVKTTTWSRDMESMAVAQTGQLNVLIISNIHSSIEHVNRLCDYIIRHRAVDIVFVCGNFVQPTLSPPSPEAMAAAEGDMTALLSRLEMIVCRVIYVPGPYDPPTTKRVHELKRAPRLTPYSINCDRIKIPLTNDIDNIPQDEPSRLMDLTVEGAKNDTIVFEFRTEYIGPLDGRYNVYTKLIRLPWCLRVVLSAAREGYMEWIEKGQLLLAPGWLEKGYYTVLTIGHRKSGDYDGDSGYEVTSCRTECLSDELND